MYNNILQAAVDKDKTDSQAVEGIEAEMENLRQEVRFPQVRQSVEALHKDDVDLIFNV